MMHLWLLMHTQCTHRYSHGCPGTLAISATYRLSAAKAARYLCTSVHRPPPHVVYPMPTGPLPALPPQGYRKPSREAYEACIATLQVPPSDLIFVDDRKVREAPAQHAQCGPV